MDNKAYQQNFSIDQFHPNDVEHLHQFFVDNRNRLQRYLPKTLESNSTLEKSRLYITTKNKEMAEKLNFTFAIRKNNKQIIGLVILKKLDWKKKQGEFAYCIGSEFEGKGVTSFAVKEMVTFAFAELGLKTLQVISHKTNLGSIKVAENNGFVWNRTLPNEFAPTNEATLDMELYELTNER